jgi:1-deoxy-D-xylulose-5-phosphate reductoisomerase
LNIAVLGSTGSIGVKSIELARKYPEHIKVVSLVAGRNWELVVKQALEHRPRWVAMERQEEAIKVRETLEGRLKAQVAWGIEGIEGAISLDEVDLVISAISGSAGVLPTYMAVSHKKDVALANKESLVMAGPIIMPLAEKKGVFLRPIDSEHCGIFQALSGHKREDIRRVFLTASGGPFRGKSPHELKGVSVEQALRHPNWRMGRKITIDSATLMNKGLEVMEAMWLFGIELDRLHILIHPQSIVHSIVEFQDGSLLIQSSVPDMIIPIAYALFYPSHKELLEKGLANPLDLELLNSLRFEVPDLKLYPCLRLALEAAHQGKSYPVVLNASNEVAVNAFLEGIIDFVEIPDVIQSVIDTHEPEEIKEIEQVLHIEQWARAKAIDYIKNRDMS